MAILFHNNIIMIMTFFYWLSLGKYLSSVWNRHILADRLTISLNIRLGVWDLQSDATMGSSYQFPLFAMTHVSVS